MKKIIKSYLQSRCREGIKFLHTFVLIITIMALTVIFTTGATIVDIDTMNVDAQNGFSSETFYKVGTLDVVEKSRQEFIQKGDVFIDIKTNEEYTLNPITMYSADGRTFNIAPSLVDTYKAVGLSLQQPITLYGVNEQTINVLTEEMQDYLDTKVWFNTSEEAKNYVRKSKYEQYPVAAEIYYCLIDRGYSSIMASGVVGNTMVETSGGTLAINPNICSSNYYGICQWGWGRKSTLLSIYGGSPSTSNQVEYIIKEMTGNGVIRQITEGQYQAICNASSPESSALAFAKYFERCDSASYNKRQKCARIAYNFFTN